MKLQKLLIPKFNITTFQVVGIEYQTTPYSKEEIREAFLQVSEHFNIHADMQLSLNNKHEMLNNEGGECILKDYIATFGEEKLLNLGCCFFAFEDIAYYNEAQVIEIVNILCAESCKTQPLIMQNYAKRCYQKIQDIKHG